MADDYIVRIYRYEKNNPKRLVGLVEVVGIEEKRGFTNFEELWGILNSQQRSDTGGDGGVVRNPGPEHDKKRNKSQRRKEI
ncbi:MAG: hypothetical protein FD174_2000 [Geobacteraceae bacterium]|nr:MAG: hypothetical protein FD174_2000 [Geobacteraceae bacterium]